jgi:hypothetical protein
VHGAVKEEDQTMDLAQVISDDIHYNPWIVCVEEQVCLLDLPTGK